MEKIKYPERIRELADQLAQKLVVRKAKSQYGACNQNLNAVIAMESDHYGSLIQKNVLWKLRMLQEIDTKLTEREPEVKKELAEELTKFFNGRIVRIADSIFARFDRVELPNKYNSVATFYGKAFDTFHKEAEPEFTSFGAVTKARPSPMRLNLDDGQHYDLGFPNMSFVSWEEIESELKLVDPSGTFTKVVTDMLGVDKGENS